jgi:uncharacterized protein YjcR
LKKLAQIAASTKNVKTDSIQLEVGVDALMSREQSPVQKQAFKLWCDSGRNMKPAEIAAELDIKPELVRKWKSYYKWEEQPNPRRGAPRGNKNAKGNKGGNGAPEGNDRAVKHGLFRKFLPDDPETLEIFDATEDLSPLEMLWTSIRIIWTNIVRSQKVMYVKDREEMIKELKKQKFEIHSTGRGKDKQLHQMVVEEEYNFQFAWDRQATALNAQSQAMSRLASKIKQYEDMIRAMPPDQVQEEHRVRLQKLKAEVKQLDDGAGKSPLTLIVDYGDGGP